MPLPADVQLLPGPDVTRLILPERQRTGSKGSGWFAIIFGLIFAGFAIFWILGASGLLSRGRPAPRLAPVELESPAPGPERPAQVEQLPPDPPAPIEIGAIIFALFGLPFLAVGLSIVGMGILSFFPSHAEILLTADTLTAIDQMGPVRFRRRRAIAQIGGLRIGSLYETSSSNMGGALDHVIYAEPAAESPAHTPIRLAPCYPVELLTPLAQFLIEELNRRGNSLALLSSAAEAAAASPNTIALTIDPEPVPAAAATDEPVPEEPVPPHPADSKIVFAPAADSLTFIIPRSGFMGSARFFLLFSFFWNGLAVPFFVIMFFELIHEPSWEHLGVLAFLSLFVAIGTAMFLAGVQAAFRKSVLLATRETLVITQEGPLRKSEFQWAPADLIAIRCADSNTTINGKALKELQIESNDKTTPVRHVFEGRDEPELQWLAGSLRHFYRVRS